ncbi:hypothetical protein PG985_014207 [Apiospora marii]|uniref:uncharacterized protein n=1 Tax=Apiospora marii TaxID=335849 RepID=UPI00312E7190
MAHITDLPTELLLGIEQHLDHPALYGGNALAGTCKVMWKDLGGTEVYRRAAKAERDLTTRTTEVLKSVAENRRMTGVSVEEDVAWVRGVARRGMGPRTTDGMVKAFEHDRFEIEKGADGKPIWGRDERGFPEHARLRYTLEDVTRKTLLNRAIMGCRDLEVLERIIDAYADVFPDIFTGACCRSLLELLPIHSAIRAKRPEVVRMLASKGLAPAKVDFLLCRRGQFRFEQRTCVANPFNVAFLTVQDEEMCLALISNSNGPGNHDLKPDLAPSALAEDDDDDPESDSEFGFRWRTPFWSYESLERRMVSYLNIAEDAGMYRLLTALLQHWKQESASREQRWNPRVILDLVSNDGPRTFLASSDDDDEELHGGIPPRNPKMAGYNADGRPYVILALLAIGADREGVGYAGYHGPIQHAVTQGYWKNAVTIFRLQERAGRVDPDDLEKALLDAADHMESGRSFLLKVAPKCWELLERSDRTAEENAQAVAQCKRKCLANSIKPVFEMWGLSNFSGYRCYSQTAALHLIQNGVKPEMSHLRLAILAWDQELCREIIKCGELDLRAKWSGFKAGPYGAEEEEDEEEEDEEEEDEEEEEDDGSSNDGDEGVLLNAFEFALLVWHQWQAPDLSHPWRSKRACPALLCDLLYHAGASDTPVSEGVCDALVHLFKKYFIDDTDPVWHERGSQIQSGSVQFTREEEDHLLSDVDAPLLGRLTMLCVKLQNWLTPASQG